MSGTAHTSLVLMMSSFVCCSRHVCVFDACWAGAMTRATYHYLYHLLWNSVLQVLALHNNYHGDTLGAMDCAASSPYNGRGQTPWYTGRGLFLEPPYLQLQRGEWQLQLPPWLQQAAGQRLPSSSWPASNSSLAAGSGVFDMQGRSTSQLQQVYQQQVAAAIDAFEQQQQQQQDSSSSSNKDDSRAVRLGALLMEPLLQGAGGMLLVDPLFQKVLVQVRCCLPQQAHATR
jgi:dethiobiotin synthetase/adenosylmethionine--8-amino-7-oxononanoate aminotransferase